ncbi:hypothetical protein LTR53_000866 [Teratosphaeriaceae sp. CCFEE 6253]|nr:hypothetical protein LTR53_000866 [Teratosphaeriaceae sp. CCFEE 6253]
MRPALRLLATAAAATHATPGAPTGLTGLLTHAAPRSTLLYLYSSTLTALAQLPPNSVYRQSTEALTKHRLSIIERVKPEGLSEWQQRVQKTVDEHPEAFRKIPLSTAGGQGSEYNIIWKVSAVQAMAAEEMGEEEAGAPTLEGLRHESERVNQREALERDLVEEHRVVPRIEPEPPLTLQQIGALEQELGAGLIEEVIQVAEGESGLVETMTEAKVWENLEESPNAGQWKYFERDTHTPTT